MAIDFILNGVRARKHQASGTKITEDGMYVEKEYMENGILKKFNPKVEIGNNGLRRIYNKKLGYLYIQDIVMDCFGSPKPADGQDWIIAHLDGNMQNDHYKNLGWKLRKDAYPHIPAKTDKQVKLANGIVVHQDGRIYQKGKKLSDTEKEKHIQLSDTDWKEIQLMLDSGYDDFTKKLRLQFPMLSEKDINFCCLVKINMSIQSLTDIYCISKNSISRRKLRLKEKIGIEDGTTLDEFLNCI